MPSQRELNPIDLSLYLVLDPELCGGLAGMVSTTEQAVAGGVTVVQLRAPQWKKRDWLRCARELKAVLAGSGVPLIINDHVDIALAVAADGVHVGQSDIPADVVRALIGPDKILGLSTNNLAHQQGVSAAIVDYIGVGPVYPTGTKKDAAPSLGLDEFARLMQTKPLPAVAIGGIKAGMAAPLIAAGADGVAVVSAICGQGDVRNATQRLKAEIAAAR
ncbi:thiamine phosphate synthase [Chitinilyticum litopenaei]|uniref:thiamine phosphate synthase n=1 Tax=Chitinilyticum litopenaei TaxID=1121276 RepID=UPI0004116DA2|nr:thiamine phosphate synthase [Chitinilyticum litopenaei]